MATGKVAPEATYLEEAMTGISRRPPAASAAPTTARRQLGRLALEETPPAVARPTAQLTNSALGCKTSKSTRSRVRATAVDRANSSTTGLPPQGHPPLYLPLRVEGPDQAAPRDAATTAHHLRRDSLNRDPLHQARREIWSRGRRRRLHPDDHGSPEQEIPIRTPCMISRKRSETTPPGTQPTTTMTGADRRLNMLGIQLIRGHSTRATIDLDADGPCRLLHNVRGSLDMCKQQQSYLGLRLIPCFDGFLSLLFCFVLHSLHEHISHHERPFQASAWSTLGYGQSSQEARLDQIDTPPRSRASS